MIAARSAVVMVRAGFGWGRRRRDDPDEILDRPKRTRVERWDAGGREPAMAEAEAAVRAGRTRPVRARLQEAQAAVPDARSRISRARSSASGSAPSRSPSPVGPSSRRGSIARLLMRMSWLAMAMNAETLPIRSPSSLAQGFQVGARRGPRGGR